MNSKMLKKLLSLLTAFAMVFGMIAMVQPMEADAATVDIAINNGDFETGAFGGAMSGSNGASIVEKATHSGNYALKFDATGETLTVTGYLAEATTAESTVTLSFWAKVLAGSTGNSVKCDLYGTNESWGNRVAAYGAGYPTVGGDWKQITQALTVPANTKIIQAQISLGAADTTAIVDDISITDGNGKELLTSGGFEKGALNGDFNANDALEIVFNSVHGGNYAAHADKSSGNGMVTATVSLKPSSEARTVTLSYWMYAPTSVNSAHNAVICYDTSNGSWVNLSTKYGVQYATVGVWTQKTLEIAVAANTDTLQIQLYAQDAGADFYIDDLTLTEDVIIKDNIVANGDFETGAFGGAMSGSNGASIVEKATRSGNYALKFDATGEFLNVTGYLAEATTAESTVTLSFWAKVLAGSTGNSVKCDLYGTNESWGNRVAAYGAGYPTVGGDWKQITQALTVPANTKIIQAQISLGAADTTAIVDDISITDGNGKELLTSGGFEKGALNGDFNANDALEIVFTPVHGGNYAAHADMTSGKGNISMTVSFLPSAEERTMVLSYWMYAPTSVNSAHNMVVCFDTSSGSGVNLSTKYGVQYATPGVWTQQTLEVAVAANTDTLQIQLYAQDEGADFYIDDLSLTEKAPITNYDITIGFNQVTADGTWQLSVSDALGGKYYKLPVIIDGVEGSIPVGISDTMMIIYPNFFPIYGASVPSVSFEIAPNAVMQPVDSNGWVVIEGGTTATVTDGVIVENAGGTWVDMSNYTDVTFTEISASDLSVYKWEDQAESNYRSVLGIKSDSVSIDNDANWGNFTKIAGKVLVDGENAGVVFGMAPGLGESSWGADNGILLYITGEGYRDAVTSASSVTICAGTMLISAVDNTHGYKFVDDFVMYKNSDGSWDTTEDPTVAKQEITISLQTVTGDGTWQMIPSTAPANTYYKAPVIIDGTQYDVLVQYGSEMLLIYDNFFTAVGGVVPTESFVIPAGTMMKAMEINNGWQEIKDALPLLVTEELRIENIAGKWVEMSKYDHVNFTEVWAADLDVYYQSFLSTADLSAWELAIAKSQYPELFEHYGSDANMTTIGIQSVIPTLRIPSNDNWANFTVLGNVSVNGAEPWETYILMTPDASQSGEHETAADNAFLLRFYNGYVGRNAKSITIEPGTMIIAADGVTGFVFMDGYTIYRDADGNWSDTAPTGTVKEWGLTLGEQIGVEFDVVLTETDTVEVAVNGTAADFTKVDNGDGTYTVTVKLAAAQMTDSIVISINGVALDKAYSVREYADIILKGGYGDLTENLVKNMLGYGAASQTYFGHNTQNLANAGIDVTAQVPTGDASVEISGSVSGIRYYGASLLHKDRTAVRLYFAADSIEGIETELKQSGSLYYVEIDGINPQNLDDACIVTVSNGTETMTVTYSPMDYIIRMYNKGNANTKALVQAMYGYYLAAEAYVG